MVRWHIMYHDDGRDLDEHEICDSRDEALLRAWEAKKGTRHLRLFIGQYVDGFLLDSEEVIL